MRIDIYTNIFLTKNCIEMNLPLTSNMGTNH